MICVTCTDPFVPGAVLPHNTSLIAVGSGVESVGYSPARTGQPFANAFVVSALPAAQDWRVSPPSAGFRSEEPPPPLPGWLPPKMQMKRADPVLPPFPPW